MPEILSSQITTSLYSPLNIFNQQNWRSLFSYELIKRVVAENNACGFFNHTVKSDPYPADTILINTGCCAIVYGQQFYLRNEAGITSRLFYKPLKTGEWKSLNLPREDGLYKEISGENAYLLIVEQNSGIYFRLNVKKLILNNHSEWSSNWGHPFGKGGPRLALPGEAPVIYSNFHAPLMPEFPKNIYRRQLTEPTQEQIRYALRKITLRQVAGETVKLHTGSAERGITAMWSILGVSESTQPYPTGTHFCYGDPYLKAQSVRLVEGPARGRIPLVSKRSYSVASSMRVVGTKFGIFVRYSNFDTGNNDFLPTTVKEEGIGRLQPQFDPIIEKGPWEKLPAISKFFITTDDIGITSIGKSHGRPWLIQIEAAITFIEYGVYKTYYGFIYNTDQKGVTPKIDWKFVHVPEKIKLDGVIVNYNQSSSQVTLQAVPFIYTSFDFRNSKKKFSYIIQEAKLWDFSPYETSYMSFFIHTGKLLVEVIVAIHAIDGIEWIGSRDRAGITEKLFSLKGVIQLLSPTPDFLQSVAPEFSLFNKGISKFIKINCVKNAEHFSIKIDASAFTLVFFSQENCHWYSNEEYIGLLNKLESVGIMSAKAENDFRKGII